MHVIEIFNPPKADLASLAVGFLADPSRGGLSDHLRLQLDSIAAGNQITGLIAVTAKHHGGLTGYGQSSPANDGSVAEVVAIDKTVERDVFETLMTASSIGQPGVPVTFWSDDPSDALTASVQQYGLAPGRVLYEMRRPLPHPESATVPTRDFRPGADDAALLEVNNLAFADHGEQGGWNQTTLDLRKHEGWFDPAGFRIHTDTDDNIDAFCWTKLHRATAHEPAIGEIYVIAVAPVAHGQGLGKQLTLAGLDSIAERGVTTGALYVDANNNIAVSLYKKLGFTIHRQRHSFHGVPRDVSAPRPETDA